MIRKLLLIIAILLGIVVIAVGALVAIASTRSDDFIVTRTATMAAPPALVFEQVNDFHKWEAWSPWAKLDPDSKVTFSGAPTGLGATFSWAGNNEVGEGKQTIVESRAPELVKIKLEFVKPFPSESDVLFTFEPQGQGTLVTWTMTGKNNIVNKVVSLFMDCDAIVGGFFEKGLASMKAVVESGPRA